MGSEGRYFPPLFDNVWNATSVSANGTSSVFNSQSSPFVSVFGNTSAAATITLQLSADNTNWYNSSLTAVAAGAGSFNINGTVGAQYLRLSSSAAATITAFISAK